MDVYMIYASGTINTIIENGFNGVYTYDGVIIYNGNGITLEELEKEREALCENYSRNFG